MTTTANDTLGTAIRAVLSERARLPVDAHTLGDTADLYAAGLTSHASVTLMLALEDEWDVEFPPALLKKSTFASIDAIRTALVEIGVRP